MMFKAIIEILTLIVDAKEAKKIKRKSGGNRAVRVIQLDRQIRKICDKYGINDFDISESNSINRPAETVITIRGLG